MAKVYDALRRAEAERRGREALDAPVSAALPWESAFEEVAPAPESVPFWKRWFRRSPTNAAVDSSDDSTKRRFAILQPDSFVAEQFRMLRGRIDSIAAQQPVKTVAVTSANAHEGKSTAAINLAAVTAMSLGRQVLLVDCDLRRPRIHSSLGLQPRAGVTEVLLDRVSFDEAVLTVESLNLDVLAVRLTPSNPSELLASPQMRTLIEEISGRYDRIIFDTPATLGLPDAKIVSELCDGLVMVVRADVTPREDVNAALEVLDRKRILGLLLNGVDTSRERYGYY
jgi:capsular exopolysaccharide synthesis family protein